MVHVVKRQRQNKTRQGKTRQEKTRQDKDKQVYILGLAFYTNGKWSLN